MRHTKIIKETTVTVMVIMFLATAACLHAATPPVSHMTTDELLHHAQSAANAGDYSGSTRIYRKALESGADSLVCLQALADNAMQMGDYAAVLEICPQLRALDDWIPYTFNYEAQANAALGNIDTATDKVVTLVWLVGIDNDSYEAMTSVAGHNLGKMAARFRKEKTADTTNPVWDECLGTILTHARLYGQAADAYLDAIRLDPESHADMAILALIYNHMRDYGKALHYATGAIALAPQQKHYVSNKAIILRNAGRSDEAINMLSDAIDTDSSYAPFLTDRGLLLASAGKYSEAIRDYDASLGIDTTAATLLRKGIALWRLGEKKEAERLFLSVTGMGYSHWSGTALAQAYLGNRKAVEEYIQYATAHKDRTANYFSLAAISDVMGEPHQALHYIELALKENTLNPDVIAYDQSLERVKRLAGYRRLLASYGINPVQD